MAIDHQGQDISHEAIYQLIYKERRNWITLLAKHHRKRFNKGHSRKHCNLSYSPNRVFIQERPKFIYNRKQVGYWRRDSLISRASKVYLEMKIECFKSPYTILEKLERKTADTV